MNLVYSFMDREQQIQTFSGEMRLLQFPITSLHPFKKPRPRSITSSELIQLLEEKGENLKPWEAVYYSNKLTLDELTFLFEKLKEWSRKSETGGCNSSSFSMRRNARSKFSGRTE